MNNTVKAPKNAKKKRRFNFVDFLLILLILALIGGTVYLFSPASFLRKLTSVQHGTLSYTVEIKNVDEDYLNMIREQDVVVDSVTKSTVGTVSTVDYSTKYSELDYVKNEDAYEAVMMEYPDRYNVLVTITAPAEYVARDGYRVNHVRIAVGEEMNLHFPLFTCTGHCISVIGENFS